MSASRASYFREYRAKRAASLGEGGLLPFQQAFTDAVCRVNHPPEIAALSISRGNGKSWLCGGLVARSITPGDPLFEPAVENILVSSSTNQARIVLEFARSVLGGVDGYRWRNDGVEHLPSRARVRIVSSDARRALGLGANVRLIVCDEPGRMVSDTRPSLVGRDADKFGQAPDADYRCGNTCARAVDGSGELVAVVCGVGVR